MRGETLVSSSNHLQEDDGKHRHTLTIRDVAYNDFGHYTCVAKNDLGEAEKTLRLTGMVHLFSQLIQKLNNKLIK